MTEDQAREKWCPMVREAIDPSGDVSINRGTAKNCIYECIASDCMMWRWDYKDDDPEFKDQDEGRCGLAK